MSDEERAKGLESLARRLGDPAGFDWAMLERIEELTREDEQ